MLDSHMRPIIERTLAHSAAMLARSGFSANLLTGLGFSMGMIAATCVATGDFWAAILFAAACRILDGLDGLVARLNGPTALGGYLDIVADFTFYAALPLGFVIYDPLANGIAGAALLASFFVNATSFLGFAILAEKQTLSTDVNGEKSHYHSVGLIEGTETIGFFTVTLIFPELFAPLGLAFAGLATLTAALRLRAAIKLF